MIKGYTDIALTVPCCRGEARVYRDRKKEKLHRSVYLNSNYISDPETETWKQRQAEAERERVKTKGEGNLDRKSRLINEKVVR